MSAPSEFTEENTGKYADVGGTRIHYNEAGERGSTIVMLHGGGAGTSGWFNFSRNLAGLAADHRVILPDLPGFGRSDPVVITGPRIAAYSKFMKGFVEKVGLGEMCLVGNSLGGTVAARFASDSPGLVRKLVLMAPAGAGESLFVPGPTEGIKQFNAVWQDPTREAVRKFMELCVYDAHLVTDAMVEARFASIRDNPQHLEAKRKSARVPEEPGDVFASLKCETLIVWGRDDRLVPLDIGLSLLRRIANSRLHVFSKCGHWAQFEKTVEFNGLLRGFLSELPTG